MSAAEPADSCFHCGLPNPGFQETLGVLDKQRSFCCRGCLEVCRAILNAGLEDYYRHRETSAVPAEGALPAGLRERLSVYDHPSIQKSFVRTQGNSKQASLILENIRCAACLWLNERHLRGLDGVIDVEVDYASHHARVRWDPARTKLSDILRAIADIGYVAHPYDPSQREKLAREHKRRSAERLIFAGVIGMLVMHFSLASYLMGGADSRGGLPLWMVIGRWTSLLATTVLLAYPGQDFFIGAWQDLRNRRLGMDVPIVLGLTTAYLGSVRGTWQQAGEVYYDSIAMFVFLLLVARAVEFRGRLKAADLIDRLNRIIPRTATRVAGSGIEEQVAVADLKPGDRLRIRPGEVVPVDGVIAEGTSSFDESVITGESLPVTRSANERIVSGSCNLEQPILVQVARDSADSTATEIQRLLETGLRRAPRYALLAQKAATWFVAIVLALAAATAGVWYWIDPTVALSNTIAVLIVTCPCALALATPVASTISAGRFAAMGILPLRMDAVEALARADTMVFDKTGTLTQGKLSLSSLHCIGSLNPDQVLSVSAALEMGSEHPVGRAIRAVADPNERREARDVRNHPGAGVTGTVGSQSWRLGKPEFAVPSSGVTPIITTLVEQLIARGELVILLSNGELLQAVLGFRDQTRQGIPDLLSDLSRLGIRNILILSGDNRASVTRFAREVGVDEALGDQSPGDKLARLGALQQDRHRVIMLGDGINDAPTLAAADVSLSFAEGTDLAQTHSDFVILTGDIRVVGSARRLARRTRRIILQNLAWAAGYNTLAVPAAAFGYIPPWAAAIGMSLSSLLVVGNAWRLHSH